MPLVSLTKGQRDFLGARRVRQGRVLAVGHQIVDANGERGAPLVAVNALLLMERAGNITPQLRSIGDIFHDYFREAGLDALRAASWLRVASAFNPANAGVVGNEQARRRVGQALKALGAPQDTVSASCAWHVLGLEYSLREWAEIRLNGKRDYAGGALIVTLETLEPVVSTWP